MAESKYTEGEQRLVNAKVLFERLFSTEDGKDAIEFLKQITGYKFPLPLSNLAVAEGARRTVCLIDVMSEAQNTKAFLAYCYEKLVDGKFLQ
jgi:hypothetical protein